MTAPNSTCRLGVTLATLSALRDDALAEAQAQTLRAHISTCAACQARLAGFDRVGQALKLQRDLEPRPSIWADIQPQLSRKERLIMPNSRRSLISGGIAALSVLIVIALFALVLLNHRPVGTSSPIATSLPPSPTPNQTSTPPVKPTPLPTATPISLGGLPSPQEVWGAGAAPATVPVGNLHVAGITADGQRILGYQPSADGKNYDVGWFNVASRTFTTIDQSAVIGPTKSNNPPDCCVTDGRFVVGANGVAEGASTNIPWFYDTQTGQLHFINSNEFDVIGINNGIVYHMGLSASQQQGALYALHLLTGVDTLVPGTAPIFNVGNFAWPAFTYTSSSDGGNTYAVHVHNLQTNADVALTQLGNVGPTFAFAPLVGDTLFFMQPSGANGMLEELDHVFTPGSAPLPLTSLAGSNSGVAGANARVVLIGDSDTSCQSGGVPCNYSLAWDRVLHKLVLLSPSANTNVWLNGNYFAVEDHTTNQVTLYDSSTFPGS